MFGRQANVVLVVYSLGWGTDGEQGGLLFFSQDQVGTYKWHGLAVGDFSQ